MTHARPIPEASQSPYPIQEAPHVPTPEAANDAAPEAAATATDSLGPLVQRARTFARERPYATAALAGTLALALFNTLRGKRVG